jgi:hypothetical protein
MNRGSRVDPASDRAEVRGGLLQKRYEMPTPLRAVPTRNGKPKERTDDATGLPTDPPSSPTNFTNMDDAVHRRRAPSSNQLSRCERKHHHIHPRTVPRSRALLGYGCLRAEDTLREPQV